MSARIHHTYKVWNNGHWTHNLTPAQVTGQFGRRAFSSDHVEHDEHCECVVVEGEPPF